MTEALAAAVRRVAVVPRVPVVLPVDAVRALADAPLVLLDPSLPAAVADELARELGAVRAGDHRWEGADPVVGPADPPVLLVADDRPAPTGTALLEAVAVMDRLRGAGGCPWDAEQTHASLLRYLVEETYELYDAVVDGDPEAMREELGDVLLQVLFHARIAAESAEGFDVDAVAADLVAKLVGRHPHVFGAGEVAASADEQNVRWEELKAVEKRRDSVLDGVALAQPAAALLAKFVSRALRAGVPGDLLDPASGTDGAVASAVVAAARAGDDPEGALRSAASDLATRVRAAEAAASAAGERLGPDVAAVWRRYWPSAPGAG